MKVAAILLLVALFLLHYHESTSSPTTKRLRPGDAGRVINGWEAEPFKYTGWMLAIFERDNPLPICGASYIGKNLVLTAAHCVERWPFTDVSGYSIHAYRHDVLNSGEPAVVMQVVDVTISEKYRSPETGNDIAIVRVTGGHDLPVYPELDDGTVSSEEVPREFTVLGWGVTQEGVQSNKLMEADVDLILQATCQQLYSDMTTIDPTMICAARDGIDSCQGDSGGPFFVTRSDNVPVIVGLTSWGLGCADPNRPGVYSRVSALRSFIDETLGCPSGTTFNQGKCVALSTPTPPITVPPTAAPIPKPTPAPLSPTPSPVAQCSVPRPHVDYEGFDIGQTKRWSPEQCCTDCELSPGCMLYVWTGWEGGTCFLKSRAGRARPRPGAVAVALLSSSMCTYRPSVDYRGNDIGNAKGKTAQECCSVCEGTAGCTVWTWTEWEGGTCWLKSNVTAAPTTTALNVISGLLNQQRCWLDDGLDYVGHDIANVRETNAERCCGHCKANSLCRAFSWSPFNGGTCWLKSKVGEMVSKQGVSSGRPF